MTSVLSTDKLNKSQTKRGTIRPIVTTSAPPQVLSGRCFQQRGIPNPVLSFEELGTEARPALLGLVDGVNLAILFR